MATGRHALLGVVVTHERTKPPGTLGELYGLAAEAEAAIGALLDHAAIRYYDRNAGSSGVVYLGWNPNRWEELDGAGQRALGQARRVVDLWVEQAEHAILAGAPERLKGFQRGGGVLETVLRRDTSAYGGAPASTIDGVRQKVAETLARQRAVIADLPTAHGEGGRVLVPDTNALLYKPVIQDWEFPPGQATLVLVPQVVRELDAKKQDVRVGDKAEQVIRQLKEYGRRGDTLQGVRLAGDVWLREVAQDPDMAGTLSWLRAGHGDDELLASALA